MERTLAVAFLVTALVATGCDGDEGPDSSRDTPPEDTSTEAAPSETADLADQRSPEELAELYAVAVPEGMLVVSAVEDPGEGTATFELSYEGEPDVDGYRQAIVDAGWEIEAEGPLASYAWCLRRTDFDPDVPDRLKWPPIDVKIEWRAVAHSRLLNREIGWEFGDPSRRCHVDSGLAEPGD